MIKGRCDWTIKFVIRSHWFLIFEVRANLIIEIKVFGWRHITKCRYDFFDLVIDISLILFLFDSLISLFLPFVSFSWAYVVFSLDLLFLGLLLLFLTSDGFSLNWFSWICSSLVFHSCSWLLMAFLWLAMASDGFLMASDGFSMALMDFLWISMASDDFPPQVPFDGYKSPILGSSNRFIFLEFKCNKRK